MTVSLKWLLDGIAAVPDNDAQIVDLAIDSRDVRAGSLFLALRGTKSHGLEHAADAAARGASAVLWEPAAGVEPPDLCRAGRSPRRSRICAGWWAASPTGSSSWPSSQMRIVGITGTNGKTTCAYLHHAVPGAPRAPCGLHGHHRLGPHRARSRRRPTRRPMR